MNEIDKNKPTEGTLEAQVRDLTDTELDNWELRGSVPKKKVA